MPQHKRLSAKNGVLQLVAIVAGLLQKQLCFAIGSNEKKRFFAHSHKREVQNTVLCNLSHVLTKSNFVLQLVVTGKTFLLTQHKRLSAKNSVLQLVAGSCKKQICFATCKSVVLVYPARNFVFFEFCTLCFSLQRVFHGIAPRFRGKIFAMPFVVARASANFATCFVQQAQRGKAFVSTCKFFQGAVSAPFCFAKNCLLFCEICFLFCQICRCVSNNEIDGK